ncbi:RNA-recognition motif (RRM) Nup35-type domain [Trinorchestia longiramus]|nr:RNA-recognition motif (RRM) Nup35-type domain [Trinorchestia longiramus]
MEPMLLGSPPPHGSPNTALPHSSSTASFLPSFLLGDSSFTSTTPSSSSPGAGRQHYNTGAPISPGTPLSVRDGMPHFPSRIGRIGAERAGGPPIHGLGGSPATHHGKLHGGQTDHLTHAYPSMESPMGYSRSLQQPESLNSSLISYEVHGEAAAVLSSSCEWITVFGFPIASASFILTQFAQLGTIADQRLPGSGNWMHLRYQTPLEARKALGLNGKILSNNIMIGVVPCTDAALVASTKENQPPTRSLLSSCPANTSASMALNSPKTGIRSLTQSYPVTPADNQVLAAANTPKKNDSFMSKAVQHLLGV